jgi:predicted nucleic acid-binding protein
MEIVTDASALLAVVLDEPERRSIIEATEGAALMAPSALPFEIGNALTAMHKRGRIRQDAVLSAWSATQRIPVQLVSVEVEAAIALALANGIYAYDAYYLHCSLSRRRPLITLDRRMREVAENLGVRLLV